MIDKLYSKFKKSSGISIDTRTIKKGELFFCLKGENFNANKFARQALEKGAKYVVVDDAAYFEQDNAAFILVDDALKALQDLAVIHREKLSIPIIGITGTNGKTTTKELVAAVLKNQFKVFATKGNYNNHIGVPLSLLSITKKHQIAVIEMGANHVGEIAELCQLSKPTLGIITNIGHAHLEGFGSYENIKKTKLGLYESIRGSKGMVFVHASDEVLMEESHKLKRLTYGLTEDADIPVQLISGKPNLELRFKDQLVSTQLFGEFNIYNAAVAIAIGRYFKISNDKIKRALEDYHPENNRSQIEKGPNNLLILDAYNANPDSMKYVISFFGGLKAYAKSVILGDMLELGEFEEEKHQEVLALIKTMDFDHVFLVGKAFAALREEFSDFEYFETSQQAKDHFERFPIRNNQILLKGSRGIKLEILKDTLL